MNRDLTVRKPERVLWQFCLPLFGSILFQQLYNIADSLVAGKFVGESALAAVGNSYEITLIFIAFAFGCNMGCSVVVSSFFGAKDYSRMKTAVSTAMIASALVCGLLMVFGLLGGGWLLRLIHTPQELMADSLLYLNIYVLGLPFVFFYNLSTGIFSAMGDSKTPFWFLAASSTANIAVDILFVTAFRMGVAGVAWATFLCQGVSCVLALVVIMRRLRRIETPERPARFNRIILQKFMRIAIPSVLQQSFISVGNIIIQSVINGFGGGVIAGYAAGVKLNNLVITSYSGGLPRRDQNSVDPGPPARPSVFLCRGAADPVLHRPAVADGHRHRRNLPPHPGAVLFRSFRKAGRGRRPPRGGADESIYDRYFYGLDSKGRVGGDPVQNSARSHGNLVRMADRLVHGGDTQHSVLPG